MYLKFARNEIMTLKTSNAPYVKFIFPITNLLLLNKECCCSGLNLIGHESAQINKFLVRSVWKILNFPKLNSAGTRGS